MHGPQTAGLEISGEMSQLVKLLSNGSDEEKEKAAAVLGNLAARNNNFAVSG